MPKPIRSVAHAVIASTLLLLVTAPGARAQSRIDLDLYDTLLTRYTARSDDIVGTRVDYAGLGKEPRWRALVEQVEGSRPEGLRSRDERLAFWINAYNILTIQTVVAHYPVDSIKDVGSFFNPVWDHTAGRIAGEPVTLGGIEHRILRPMGEPRIHAAIVCASTSCPSLARSAFRPERLDAQLDAATRRWLRDARKGAALDRARERIAISRIFKWFEADFEAVGGPLRFIAAHLDDGADAEWLRAHADELRVSFFDYDWSLNAAR